MFEGNGVFLFKDITRVNHSPHPYTIGPKHIKHASDNHGGMLGEQTLRKIPCAAPKCTASYEEHTSDTVLFIQLKRNVSAAEGNKILNSILSPKELKEDDIDGFAFLETEEKYRFTDEEE